jgi:hypothetical protein
VTPKSLISFGSTFHIPPGSGKYLKFESEYNLKEKLHSLINTRGLKDVRNCPMCSASMTLGMDFILWICISVVTVILYRKADIQSFFFQKSSRRKNSWEDLKIILENYKLKPVPDAANECFRPELQVFI